MQSSHLPLRAATGAFILNSGLSKRGLDAESAEQLQAMATNAFPQLGKLSPQTFAQVLSTAEIALGAALLVPIVPSTLAGAGLAAFGAGLTQLYLSTPGMHEEGGVRPTTAGTGLAKDVWLVGAGLTLVLDGLAHRARKTARKAAGKASASAVKSVLPGTDT